LWADARKLAFLAGQIEASWKSLNDEEKTRLLPQLDRVATETTGSAVAARLRKLTSAAGGGQVPYDLIEAVSEVGKALRSVLVAAPEPDAAKAKLIRLLAGYPVTGKPGPKWIGDAGLVQGALRQPAGTIAAVLDAALDAPDHEHKYHGTTHRYTRYASKSDEAFLCGITILAGQVSASSADLLPRLRRLALKAITFIGGQYGHPRSVRLANHCVQAIAAAALPSSVTELLKTERSTRHGALLRQVRKSVDALAATQGLTRAELLEMAVEDHGLSPDGTRRVPLADGIDHGVARREYAPAGGRPPVRAEFFFDPADYQDHAADLYRYCASDQVRFFDAGTGDAVPLAGIAAVTFSEAMRDVDLFIGVTSIGADPEWLDRGEGRRFGDYWHRYAFGDLGAGAEVRRDVLARLVPMLAIADRCELESRFLKVRGDLHTYRIHLGSGNILMSPNDQYLCIVAARDARAGKLFLPFDDDPILSLILSKAFLLAGDAKITDQSITRQIGSR